MSDETVTITVDGEVVSEVEDVALSIDEDFAEAIYEQMTEGFQRSDEVLTEREIQMKNGHVVVWGDWGE